MATSWKSRSKPSSTPRTAISRTAAAWPASSRAPPDHSFSKNATAWSRTAAPLRRAGKLPFKGVIHAVGPRQGEGDEEQKLVQALASAFALASERGWQSVSFPAVSAGIFAVPLDICARAYVKAARAARLSKVRLCLRDQPVIDAVLKELEK